MSSEQVRFILDESEQRGMCAWSKDPALHLCLCRAAKAGKIMSPCNGVFVRQGYWDRLDVSERHLCLVRTLAAIHPHWIFSHVSAAVVYGYEVSWELLGRVHVSVPRSGHARSTEMVVRHAIDGCEWQEVDGIRVTCREQTVFDCMRFLDFREGLAIADSHLRATGQSAVELRDYVEQYPGSPRGRKMAQLVSGYADGLSENGGESKARGSMIIYGYEIPQLQVTVTDPIDQEKYRLDYLWELAHEALLGGELDGYGKYTDEKILQGRTVQEVLDKERLRESRISAKGIVVVRFRLKETYNRARFERILDSYGVPRVHRQLSIPKHPSLKT